MEMNGSRIVPTDVATTWKALNDPEVLKACIPGCETIESSASNEYKVTMTARVGPVSARFSGRIVLSGKPIAVTAGGGRQSRSNLDEPKALMPGETTPGK